MNRSKGVLFTATSHMDIKFSEVFSSFTYLFLPSWTWQEFEAVVHDPVFASAMWPQVAQLEGQPLSTTETTSQTLRAYMKRKFEICGGNARLMFTAPIAKCREILVLALDTVPGYEARNLLFSEASESGVVSLMASHRIMQLLPRAGSDCTVFSCSDVFWLVGSKFVLMQLRRSLLASDLQNLVDKLPGIDNPSIRGWVFEEFVHACMDPDRQQRTLAVATGQAQQQVRIRMRIRGTDTQKKDVVVSQKTREESWVFSGVDLFSADTLKTTPARPGFYCRPTTINYPTLDSFFLSADQAGTLQLSTLQITIRDQHSAKEAHILELFNWLCAFPLPAKLTDVVCHDIASLPHLLL
eukprot:TRINITY_DN2656_c0_g1_i11.p1 TRINITY_DN2656_c0_g1~~TRINITY_DN2656_c0_g1_i11.p1  ORF type:complete len:354 (+),score=38.15 TRINITY_DN2656_c0_g1_i11:1766-2827(+)